MAGAFGDGMGFGGNGYGIADPNAGGYGADSFGLPQFGTGGDFGAGSFGGAAGYPSGGGNDFGAASFGGSPGPGDGFGGNAEGFGGGFNDMAFASPKDQEKRSKKDKKSKKNATISDEVLYADPYGQVWGPEGRMTQERPGEYSPSRHHRGDYSFDDSGLHRYGDHVHIKDRYHGVRAYDPWKDIPERPELEPFYTERLQETLGSDYLPHHRTDPPFKRSSASEIGGPVLLSGGAADSRAIPTRPSPAGPFLRTIVPAFRDERRASASGAGSALMSPTPAEPMSDLGWWPLPRRASAARSAASTLGVKLDNFTPGTELWHSVTELTEAFKRATPEADLKIASSSHLLPLEGDPTVVRRISSPSPRPYRNVVIAEGARPKTPPLRPRSSSPPRRWPLERTRSVSPSSRPQPWRDRIPSSPAGLQPLQSSRVVSDAPGAGRIVAASVWDDSRGMQAFSGSRPVHQIHSSAVAARPLGSSGVVGSRSGQVLEQSFSRRWPSISGATPLLSANSLASSSAASGFAGHPVSAY